MPPAFYLPGARSGGAGWPCAFPFLGLSCDAGQGCQLFTLPDWGSCFPASLLSCGTSPQPYLQTLLDGIWKQS